MSRFLRRCVAWLGILGIVFAQFVATAHACAPGGSAGHERPGLASAASAAAAAGHCAGHAAAPVAPAGNLCEVHCTDGATPATALDLPPVALAPLPVAAPALAALAVVAAPQGLHPAPLPAGPPIVLRFGHFLI